MHETHAHPHVKPCTLTHPFPHTSSSLPTLSHMLTHSTLCTHSHTCSSCLCIRMLTCFCTCTHLLQDTFCDTHYILLCTRLQPGGTCGKGMFSCPRAGGGAWRQLPKMSIEWEALASPVCLHFLDVFAFLPMLPYFNPPLYLFIYLFSQLLFGHT